jgi:hypothetical protein
LRHFIIPQAVWTNVAGEGTACAGGHRLPLRCRPGLS